MGEEKNKGNGFVIYKEWCLHSMKGYLSNLLLIWLYYIYQPNLIFFYPWYEPLLSRYPGLYQVQTRFLPGGLCHLVWVYTRGFIPASPNDKDRICRTSSQIPPSTARLLALRSDRLVKQHCLAWKARLLPSKECFVFISKKGIYGWL